MRQSTSLCVQKAGRFLGLFFDEVWSTTGRLTQGGSSRRQVVSDYTDSSSGERSTWIRRPTSDAPPPLGRRGRGAGPVPKTATDTLPDGGGCADRWRTGTRAGAVQASASRSMGHAVQGPSRLRNTAISPHYRKIGVTKLSVGLSFFRQSLRHDRLAPKVDNASLWNGSS